MNAVVIAVCLMLGLSLARINVVIALTISAIVAGLSAGLGINDTISAFNEGLGGGAKIALGYAMLGAFAVALSRSGITDLLAHKLLAKFNQSPQGNNLVWVKFALLSLVLMAAVSSQNILPIHIAFVPILIPPLLILFNELQMDRRLVACVITFGLVTTYMVLPLGFGGIFLNDILLQNLQQNGLTVALNQVPKAMLLPASGMVFGLLVAVFISYRKPRQYQEKPLSQVHNEPKQVEPKQLLIALTAIIATLLVQLTTDSMIIGALTGFMIFSLGGTLKADGEQDAVLEGMRMMAMIGFIMIAAAGFASVVKATNEVPALVDAISGSIGQNKALAAMAMLIVGLLITMGIGSSFSTIPIIATIYVPLALEFGFSPMAIIALVGTAGALGDAGSPASDSTLGPTSGLNADGQHDHIRDSVIPTFLHYNLPLLVTGWIAVMVL
ncbi:Na+/H+ antiporter family protein [Paraferrimonas sp. SM1919]|uniref:Na+/H+ antiporter family protein n=1 Tax=Paraferrimonas sp. SM1919 TaxID=2662263 RepID=UPI0013D33307|nr:Na+/H+ antiporter family protein [Paraferrimonas sp. SM1919]